MSSSHFNELQLTDISSQTKEILSEDYFSKMKGPLQNLQPKFTKHTEKLQNGFAFLVQDFKDICTKMNNFL